MQPLKDLDDLGKQIGNEGVVALLNTRTVELPIGEEETQKPASETWLAHFSEGTVPSAELQTMELPHHDLLLGDWCAEGDLGFVFAARGVGKTHLCLFFARALAEGTAVGPWRARRPVPVLYVDGEMNAEQIRVRDAALANGGGDLYYLNHEVLFARTEKTMNLADRAQQQALTKLCDSKSVRVLILDNLACLVSGVKENDNDEWEALLPWLLDLRRRNIAVIFVHHAGRNGQMRGASRREDAAAWVLRLDDALDGATVKRGAKFISMFTKPSRHTAADVPPYEWEFVPEPSTGRCTVSCKMATGLELFVEWVRDGLSSCSEIADEMSVSKGTVSKLAKQAMTAGLIRIVQGKYFPKEGNERSDE